MARVLVTAFQPFGGQAVNSSLEALRAFAGSRSCDASIITATLPVIYGAATEALADAVTRSDPSAVVALGQADGQDSVCVERVALNHVTAPAADEAGRCLVEAPVLEGGPVGYWSTLPVGRLVAKLRAAGIPATASSDAGGFVCNHLFYGLMRLLVEERPGSSGGLIHLPCLPEQAAGTRGPSMALEILASAVEIAVAVVREHSLDPGQMTSCRAHTDPAGDAPSAPPTP